MTEEKNALQDALHVADNIPQNNFAQLLRRIAIAIRQGNQNPFSEDDVQTLLESFSLTPSQLDALFSACSYLLQKSACFSFNSDKTSQFALESGASEEVAECFSAVWDKEGDELIEALKQKTIASSVLDSTTWRLDLKADEHGKGPSRDPVLLLDFNIVDQPPVTVQFNHEEFILFIYFISKIQNTFIFKSIHKKSE